MTLAYDRDANSVWVGIVDGGIAACNLNRQQWRVLKEPLLKDIDPTEIKISKERVFVGSEKGLFAMDKKTERWSYLGNFPDNFSIHHIHPGNGGTTLKKAYTIGLMIFLVLMFLETCYGNKLTDYKIVYHNTSTRNEPFRSINMNLIVYCQGGQKFRIEPEVPQKTEESGNPYSMISIIRLDKHVTWFFDPKVKMSAEKSIPDNLIRISDFNMLNWPSEPVKIGEESILGNICDICIFTDQPENKYWIGREHGIILKMEQSIGSNKYLSEAIELKIESQDDSLFELPPDCKIIKMGDKSNIMEDLVKPR